MTRARVFVASGVVLVLMITGWWWWGFRQTHAGTAGAEAPRTWAPLPHPVTAEVLNATRVAGLGRVGTLELRQLGFDVKYFGNADSAASTRRVTRLLVRGGDTTGVGRVLEAMGTIPVEYAAAPERFVDLTLILGDDYHGLRRP